MAGMSSGLDGFFDMGGYGAFVWPAYALVAALLVWLLVHRIGRLKRREAELARLEQRRQGERAAPATSTASSSAASSVPASAASAKERA
jgi:heme exporter protein D